MDLDVVDHALAHVVAVHVDVEQLRPEIGDDRKVDTVLQLGERVAAGARTGDRSRCTLETLVEIHVSSSSRTSAGCAWPPQRPPRPLAVAVAVAAVAAAGTTRPGCGTPLQPPTVHS